VSKRYYVKKGRLREALDLIEIVKKIKERRAKSQQQDV
jgi:hypothetical protein